MEYEKDYYVNYEHITPDSKLSIMGILRYAQEIATIHAEMLNLGDANTRDRGIVWVVARYHFEIDELPNYKETIKARTWPGKMISFMFPRNFEFEKDGKTIIRGNSAWCFIDLAKRNLIMQPANYGLELNGETNGRELPFAGGLRAPELPNTSILKAGWADCDINLHLNNVHYFDLCLNLMPLSILKEQKIVSFDVSYKKEILLGEEVAVAHGLVGDKYWFSCPNFVISIQFANK